MTTLIKLTEKLKIKINVDDDFDCFFGQLFEDGVSRIVNDYISNIKRNYSNLGPEKNRNFKHFFTYNDEIENDENNVDAYFPFDDNGLKDHAFFTVDVDSSGHIGFIEQYKKGQKINASEVAENIGYLLILDCKYLGIKKKDARKFIENWITRYNCIIDNEVYFYELIELEKCNLGHYHENSLESCGGFLGYKNDSEMILDMLRNVIKFEEITYFDDLKKHLNENDFLKIKTFGLVG